MDCPIEDKIYNIWKVVEEIHTLPQTYDTILQYQKSNSTLQLILRKKLNKLHKQGEVLKTIIPKTRYGKVMYYINPRCYTILFIATRTGQDIYCVYEYIRRNNFVIDLTEYFILKKNVWERRYKIKRINLGHALKWI